MLLLQALQFTVAHIKDHRVSTVPAAVLAEVTKSYCLSYKLTVWTQALSRSKHKHSPGEGNLKGRRGGGECIRPLFGRIKSTLKTIQSEMQQKLMAVCQ